VSDRRPFVKSRDTSTSAVNSRSAVDKMLRRYGASAISMSEDIEQRRILVSFIIPDSAAKDAPRVPVKLPISIFAVYDSLYGRPRRYDYGASQYVTDAKAYDAKRLEQAERVAWRNLMLWIDAALSAAAVGLQTITEAFFAHAVVGAGGERMIEVVEQAQAQLGAGVQRLLTATTEQD
jgi:hypothetical protein